MSLALIAKSAQQTSLRYGMQLISLANVLRERARAPVVSVTHTDNPRKLETSAMRKAVI